MKDWHQRALELASEGLRAKAIVLKLQEERGDILNYNTVKSYILKHKNNCIFQYSYFIIFLAKSQC